MADWNDAISWTSAVREPMRRLTNRVVTTYGIASLATVACPVDKELASDLFREAVEDLNSVPDATFHDSKKVLPVATFSGLWKLVMGPGMKCDARLPQPNDRARAKRDAERQEAASYLEQAKVADDPERAAQLAQAAMEAGDAVSDQDLREFAEDRIAPGMRLDHVEFGQFSGFTGTYLKGNSCWNEWWLRSEHLMLYATYNVGEQAAKTELSAIRSILSSLSASEGRV
jgi:hypothetical protein